MKALAEQTVGLVCSRRELEGAWHARLDAAGLAVRPVRSAEDMSGLGVIVIHAATVDEAHTLLPAGAGGAGSTTPVLVVLAEGDSEARSSVLEAGADDCLTCPVSPRELALRVARLASLAELSRQTAHHSARLAREMAHARRVQEHILPLEPPHFDGLEIAARYVPAADIGGDFFDILPLGERRVGFFMADVAGHGVGAALNTMLLKSQLVIWARPGITATETLGMLNNYLHELTGLEYATAIYAVLDLDARSLEYVVAGHPNPLLVRPGRPVRMLEAYTAHGDTAGVHVGLPLGLFDDGVYISETVQLERGDRVLFYTDGLIEWRDAEGRMLGIEGLRDLVEQSRDRSLERLADGLIACMQQARPDEPPADDANLVAFELL